jgi:hypothetical protein
MKLSKIISVQDQWQNTDYDATMILKTMQDGKKCEATEQVTSEHKAVSGEQYAYARIWHEMVCTQLI